MPPQEDAAASRTPLEKVIDGLLHGEAVDDPRQVLDALWLGAQIGGGAKARIREQVAPVPEARSERRLPDLPQVAHVEGSSAHAREEVEVDDAPAPVQAPPGLFARLAESVAGEGRARVVRVAGVPALRDRGAMARELRPAARRRPSPLALVLDEERTAELYCETGVLSPCFSPGRERFFDAVLLVEQSDSLPLWRQLVGELADLFARQVGFRSFQRMQLLATREGVVAGSGATVGPLARIPLGPRPLVLIASDGTSHAWASGHMAEALQGLGRRSTLAVVQLLPSRLWPNSALGGADVSVTSPYLGAVNALLDAQRPRSLELHPDKDAQIIVPVMSLLPASMGAWARMVAGQGGARGRAAVAWLARDKPARPRRVVDTAAKPAMPGAAELVERFGRFTGPATLDVAVHLSSAAPLTLSVIRLVQRVMAPDAAAEDLPLLLLGGLLESRPPIAVDDAVRRAGLEADDLLQFEFVSGVRQHLQRSLRRRDASRVLQAVMGYIAEHVHSPIDFAALRSDPRGDVALPEWARPFATIAREVDALFDPPKPAAAATPRVVEERRLAPGVTLRAAGGDFGGVRRLAYSPDGMRLLVLDDRGAGVLAIGGEAGGFLALEPPRLHRGKVEIVLAVDARLGSDWTEEFIHAMGRTDISSNVTAHLIVSTDKALLHMADQVGSLVLPAVVCLVSSERAYGAWTGRIARTLNSPLRFKRHAGQRHEQLLIAIGREEDGDWLLQPFDIGSKRRRTFGPVAGHDVSVSAELSSASEVAEMTLDLIRAELPGWLPREVFGGGAVAADWAPNGELAVFDEADGLRIGQRPPRKLGGFTPGDPGYAMAFSPDGQLVALAQRSCLHFVIGEQSHDFDLPHSTKDLPPALAWSPDGKWLACVQSDGKLLQFEADGEQAPILRLSLNVDQRSRRRGRSVAWRPDPTLPHQVLVAPAAANAVRVVSLKEVRRSRPIDDTYLETTDRPVHSVSWSPDGELIAVGLAGGVVNLVPADPGLQRAVFEVGTFPRSTRVCVAFAPAPISRGQDELAVGVGPSVLLLRIQRDKLASAVRFEHKLPAVPAIDTVSERDQLLDLFLQSMPQVGAPLGLLQIAKPTVSEVGSWLLVTSRQLCVVKSSQGSTQISWSALDLDATLQSQAERAMGRLWLESRGSVELLPFDGSCFSDFDALEAAVALVIAIPDGNGSMPRQGLQPTVDAYVQRFTTLVRKGNATTVERLLCRMRFLAKLVHVDTPYPAPTSAGSRMMIVLRWHARPDERLREWLAGVLDDESWRVAWEAARVMLVEIRRERTDVWRRLTARFAANCERLVETPNPDRDTWRELLTDELRHALVDAFMKGSEIPILGIGTEGTDRLRSLVSAYATWLDWHDLEIAVRIRVVDDGRTPMAYFEPAPPIIILSTAVADDQHVVLRQVTHGLLDIDGKSAADGAAFALESGLADYFPCSFTGVPHFGVDDQELKRLSIPPGQFGVRFALDRELNFPASGRREVHQVGEAWGSAFWALRGMFGPAKFDPILLATWYAGRKESRSHTAPAFVMALLERIRAALGSSSAREAAALFTHRKFGNFAASRRKAPQYSDEERPVNGRMKPRKA